MVTSSRLVTTDAMARGMDIADVDLVVSFEPPSAHTYVHRVGRTARAGRSGDAVSIVSHEEVSSFASYCIILFNTCILLM